MPKSGTRSYNKKLPSQSNDDNHPARVKQTNAKQSTKQNTKDRENDGGGKGGKVLSDDFLDKFKKSEGVSEKILWCEYCFFLLHLTQNNTSFYQ